MLMLLCYVTDYLRPEKKELLLVSHELNNSIISKGYFMSWGYEYLIEVINIFLGIRVVMTKNIWYKLATLSTVSLIIEILQNCLIAAYGCFSFCLISCNKVIFKNRIKNFLVETSFCQFSNMASPGLKKMFILQFYIHKKVYQKMFFL